MLLPSRMENLTIVNFRHFTVFSSKFIYCLPPRTSTISARQLDPAPGATIGGMLSTGCSGSVFRFVNPDACV